MNNFAVYMINIDFYPLLGGAQMHTLRLSRFLRAQGVSVEVITRHHPGLAYQEKIDGVPVVRTPVAQASKAAASLSFTYHALKHIATSAKSRGQKCIVHSHEMLSPMTIGLLSRALLGTRLVINPHRGGYLGDVYKLNNRRRWTGRARLAWAGSAADAFVSVSQEITGELRGAGVAAEKIHFIPYALDTAHFQPAQTDARAALRTRLQLDGKIAAGYTGRLAPEKGLDLLLQAWSGVVAAEPAAVLLIVGDGEQRAALESQAARLGIEGSVHFIGQVSDTSPYLQACDLYVQPSYTEGLPIAMLEAMACGLPVLATAVGGTPDLIASGQNGLLVLPRDGAALQHGLSCLVADAALRARLGGCAWESVVAYCAIENIGADHIEMYRQILHLPAAAK